MGMVSNPHMEGHETNRKSRCLDVCIELGEKDEAALTLTLSQGEKGPARPYSLIFFKNPGVFNSRSSK